jgi:hypothetical protein
VRSSAAIASVSTSAVSAGDVMSPAALMRVITLTCTRAVARSGDTSTPVMEIITSVRGGVLHFAPQQIRDLYLQLVATFLHAARHLSHLLHVVADDLVAFREVREALDLQTAFEAGANVARVFLEALQALEASLVHLLAATEHARHRVAAQSALAHVAAGDGVAAAEPEHLPHLSATVLLLVEDGSRRPLTAFSTSLMMS